jgi:hypothetical protein
MRPTPRSSPLPTRDRRSGPEEPDCKDLWLHYDAATGSVDIDLQGEDLDLGGSGCVVNDASRSLEEGVVALTGAVKRFLVEASATHCMPLRGASP